VKEDSSYQTKIISYFFLFYKQKQQVLPTIIFGIIYLRTASGAAEFEQFINTYPSQKVAIRYKGYSNYKDPES